MDAKDKLISHINELKKKLNLPGDGSEFLLTKNDKEYLTVVLLCEIDKARKITPDDEILTKQTENKKETAVADEKIYDDKIKKSRIDKKV